MFIETVFQVKHSDNQEKKRDGQHDDSDHDEIIVKKFKYINKRSHNIPSLQFQGFLE